MNAKGDTSNAIKSDSSDQSGSGVDKSSGDKDGQTSKSAQSVPKTAFKANTLVKWKKLALDAGAAAGGGSNRVPRAPSILQAAKKLSHQVGSYTTNSTNSLAILYSYRQAGGGGAPGCLERLLYYRLQRNYHIR